MSLPAPIFSSPTPYSRPLPVDDAIKQTPRSKVSPFPTRYYTPSSLERNKNPINSLSSTLSSTPHRLKKPLAFNTPQNVPNQLAWHHHSTPQSQVKNPFEIALVNQLQNSLVSPGIFTIATPSTEEKNFHWTIDQLSVLHPVHIDEKQPQYTSVISPNLEVKAQQDIDSYFSTHIVVPSPAEELVKVEKNVKLLEVGESKKSIDVGCQTMLSLPENVNLDDVLGDYMTYKETKTDNDSGALDSFSTSSLRRNLFCQGYRDESFSSNKASAKSDGNSSSEDELPVAILNTPGWDRQSSKDLLSSSPVNRRSRNYMTNLSRDSFGFAHSSPNFSPIDPPLSPLSSRSHHRKKGLHIYLEDSRKQLFSSPTTSPISVDNDVSEKNPSSIDDGKMDMPPISRSDSAELILNTSFLKMSPLLSSVQKELQVMSPNTNWDLDSELDVSLIPPEEETQNRSDSLNMHSVCEQGKSTPCAADNHLCMTDPMSNAHDNTTNNDDAEEEEEKCNTNAISDLQNITSSMSANFSIIPSKLETTNVDNSRYVSTLQQDTGYMSYNTMSSMPSRSEISQCSKSVFSLYNSSSSQDIPESLMDANRLLSEKGVVSDTIPPSKMLGLKLSAVTSYADSLLDYDEVVDRARQVLTLTSKFCIGQPEEPPVAETDEDKTSDMLRWQPIGASTPTHKGSFKSASETAAEILQKAQDELNKLSRGQEILS